MRKLPQSIEAEAGLITALLLKEPEIAKKTLGEISFLQAEDFSDKIYSTMYMCIQKAVAEKNTLDVDVVVEYCLQHKINPLQTIEIITKLTTENVLAVAQNPVEKAKIIRRKAIMRQILSLERQILLVQQEPDFDTNTELFARVTELKNTIVDLEKELSLFTTGTIFTESIEGEDDTVDFVCRGLIPKDNLTVIAGESGIGKTFTVIHIPYIFLQETKGKGKVALWLSEDSNIRWRLRSILQFYPHLAPETVKENIKFTREPPVSFFLDENKGIVNRQMLNLINITLNEFDMLVLDPLSSFFGGNENSNTQAKKFFNTLQQIAKERKKIIIVVHHVNKEHLSIEKDRKDDSVDLKTILEYKKAVRGASTFGDAARNIIFVRPSKIDKKKRQLIVIKSNYGATGKTTWVEMPFTPVEDVEEENAKIKKAKIPYR